MADVPIDEHGRPETPLDADELTTLLAFLDYQRASLGWKTGHADLLREAIDGETGE